MMALHVALFHYVTIEAIDLNIFGHTHMSFFILLSGFSLSAAYSSQRNLLDRGAFYLSRFARTMPMTYLTHASVALLSPLGHASHPGDFFRNLRNSITATAMWIFFDNEPRAGWNGPAWTVSTLVAYYWMYPFLSEAIARLADARNVSKSARLVVGCITALAVAHGAIGWALRPDSAASWTIGADSGFTDGAHGVALGIAVGALTGIFVGSGILGPKEASTSTGVRLDMPPSVHLLAWLQFAIGLAMLFNGVPVVGKGYWVATGWVPSRVPLFLMGAVAGAVRAVGHDRVDHAAAPEARAFFEEAWARRTDAASAIYLGALASAITFTHLAKTYDWEASPFYVDAGPLTQLVLPYVQLTIAVGLERSGKASRTARLCMHPWCQWLGKISMALYLVHMPVFQWLVALLNGRADWTLGGRVGADVEAFRAWQKGCRAYRKEHGHQEPGACTEWADAHNVGAWAVPVATVLSLVAAALLEKHFETPMRTWLRGQKKMKREEHQGPAAGAEGDASKKAQGAGGLCWDIGVGAPPAISAAASPKIKHDSLGGRWRKGHQVCARRA